MRPRQLAASRDAAAIFDRAVEERALAVLTLQGENTQGENTWQSFKSRFLERDPKQRFFVLDYQPLDDEALPAVNPGVCVGVSFRQKGRKLLFATVVEAKGHFALDGKTNVAAVRYRWPESLTEMQRRAYFRTPVPDDVALRVDFWAGGVRARAAGHGPAPKVLSGHVADLSCGGTLIRLQPPGPVGWVNELVLGLELHLPDGRPPILVDGRYRGSRADDSGVVGAAIQFVGLELSADGRVVLQRLANAVQRLHRLGLAPSRRGRGSPNEA